ncbi:MAG: TonB-dependent receptor [Raineya sp.]|jgi:outer membrane receptor for ferrienterochelin and colicin|nr:TonB-dependent receptor [Raineya sp.]
MNKIYPSIFLCICWLLWDATQAQNLHGSLKDSQRQPIIGANIFWLNTSVGTVTTETGEFSISKSSQSNQLVISAVGFLSDTLVIAESQHHIEITLKSETSTIQTVEVKANSSFKDKDNAMLNEFISRKELTKAACCNLSESFETNASVDVSYQDAVTGSKQIKMLGLDGSYVLINAENMPFVRGLASTYGLNFIPGTWIQSIDLVKGAGSVVNGYESMSGQINVELMKPDAEEKLLLNAYLNHFGRVEGNAVARKKLNDKWSTNILAHASTLQNKVDLNNDGFVDMPLYTQYNVMNRWKRSSEKMMNQFGVKFLSDVRRAGQNSFFEANPSTFAYGTNMNTQRVEFFAKNAILYPKKPYQGLGLVSSAILHTQDGFLGNNVYKGTQKTLYNNLIYQNILGNTNHSYKLGISHLLDSYDESFADSTFRRNENVLGAFVEYTYTHAKKFTLVAGNRIDKHNLFGWQYTPRLHLKYDITENTLLRLSAGRGFRVPNPIAENFGFLVNNRKIFGEMLQPEVSWNFGVSLQKEFDILERKASLVIDFFHTNFTNQMVVDMDRSATEIYFTNLNGKSFANSFQTELSYSPMAGLETKVAYKLYDVQSTLAGRLQERPFISRNRFFVNASYTTRRSGLQFDATVKWNGRQRLPLSHNPLEAQNDRFSPSFATLNAQVSKNIGKKWEVYLGGENLTNFRQLNPIESADNPQNPHFDASMIWGPVVGRMIYSGVRVKFK